ncbi:hypothetical protein GEMRC1_009893 [Eukaryota sp. GEM-RC1]
MNWVSVDGHVYDVSSYKNRHPGGKLLLEAQDGHDISELMRKCPHRHSDSAFKLLGRVVPRIQDTDDLHPRQYHNEFDTRTPMTSRINELSSVYNSWVWRPIFSVHKNRIRIFKHNFLENLTVSPFWLVPLLWIPGIIYLSFTALSTISLPAFLILFIIGLILWAPFEYFTHKYLFHLQSKQKLLQLFQFIIHGNHHKCPSDRFRLVFPPVPAFLFGTLPLYFLLQTFLSAANSKAFMAGFLLSYVSYDLTHYGLHFIPEDFWTRRRTSVTASRVIGVYKRLRKSHMNHHYNDYTTGFGISLLTACFVDFVSTVFGSSQVKRS